MPHSKPHATLFSSDELVEPSKIGNHVCSDKRIMFVSVMELVPEYVSGENEKLANNKFILSAWLSFGNLHP